MGEEEHYRPDRLTLAAYTLMILLGGSNSVAVRFSNAELPPFWGATLRFTAATVLLFAVVAVRRIPVPGGRALFGTFVYASLGLALGFACYYWALVQIKASQGQVILALSPLITIFLARLHRLEAIRPRAIVGALIAAGGTAVIFREQLSAAIPVAPLLAMLGSAAFFAESGVIAKLLRPASSVAFNAVSTGFAALELFVLSLVWREPLAVPQRLTTWLALAYLTLVGTILLFVLYIAILRRWTASAMAYQFVLLPFVTVTVGSLLAGEGITGGFVIGGGLVLLGVYIGALSSARTRSARSAAGA